jgi:hypothetical protein
MRNVPWDQALDVVLQAKGLGMVCNGNLIRVAPLATLQKERELRLAAAKQEYELTSHKTAHPARDAPHPCQLCAGRRAPGAREGPPLATRYQLLRAVEGARVQMHVEIQARAKALDKRDGARVKLAGSATRSARTQSFARLGGSLRWRLRLCSSQL